MVDLVFIETVDFINFARYVCAFREYPLRVYSQDLNGQRILATRRVLSKSLLLFYTPFTKIGGYISYNAKDGKEYSDIVNSTKPISTYAPITHIDSLSSSFKTSTKIQDKFEPIKLEDLGSLARLTYNPELPEEPDLTLMLFPQGQKWIIGYITTLELDDTVYCFNYVELNEIPKKQFLKYLGHEGMLPEFTDKFEHGFTYFPVIQLKKSHAIFGLMRN